MRSFWCLYCFLWIYFTSFSSVSVVYFEQMNVNMNETVKRTLFRKLSLTLSWPRPISYRNQSSDLQSKSMDWFLYDNDFRYERVKNLIRRTKNIFILCILHYNKLAVCLMFSEIRYSYRKRTIIIATYFFQAWTNSHSMPIGRARGLKTYEIWSIFQERKF